MTFDTSRKKTFFSLLFSCPLYSNCINKLITAITFEYIWIHLIFEQKPCFLGPIKQELSWLSLNTLFGWSGQKLRVHSVLVYKKKLIRNASEILRNFKKNNGENTSITVLIYNLCLKGSKLWCHFVWTKRWEWGPCERERGSRAKCWRYQGRTQTKEKSKKVIWTFVKSLCFTMEWRF